MVSSCLKAVVEKVRSLLKSHNMVMLKSGLEFHYFRGKATWPFALLILSLRAQRPDARAGRPLNKTRFESIEIIHKM